MSKIIGLDAGNSAIKIATENLQSITPTFLAPGVDLRSYGKREYKKDQLLDVFVSSPVNKISGRYFVGKLAYNESKARLIERNPMAQKSEDDVLLIVSITAIAFHLLTENPNATTEYIKLYISMPIEEYFSEKGYRKIMTNRFKTTHTVKFLDPSFNGAEVKIIVENVEVIPEGTGAFYSFIKDEESFKKNRLLIDFGRFTTDVLYFESGEFQRTGFIGIDEGTATPIGEIQKYLSSHYGLNYSYFQIDNALRNNNKKIKGRGKIYDLTEISANAFKNFSFLINNRIGEKIKQNAIDLNNADDVLLVGGGAMLMSSYLNLESLVDGLNIIFSENPIMANAIGNYILGKADNNESDNEDENETSDELTVFEETEDDIM